MHCFSNTQAKKNHYSYEYENLDIMDKELVEPKLSQEI